MPSNRRPGADGGATSSCSPPPSPLELNSVSSLHVCLTAPSPEEAELERMLQQSEQQLGRMAGATPKKYVDGRVKYLAMVAAMRRTVGDMREAIAQRLALRHRESLLQQQIALAEREQRRLWLPTPYAPAPPAAACPAVSVHDLPRAGADWDAAWTARVRAMHVSDLLLLHRQWLQLCAVKLPRVELLHHEPARGAAAAAELRDLYDAFVSFTHRVLMLKPELWHEAYAYSLDSLQPMAQPPTCELLETYYRNVPGYVDKLQPVYDHFQRIITALRSEEAGLRRAYARLAHDMQLPCALHNAMDSSSRTQAFFEADRLLALLDANLRQQKMQVANFVHAASYALPLEQALQLKIALYPMACNGQALVLHIYSQPVEPPQ